MDFQDLEITAQLAQLELSSADKERLSSEIDQMLEYFDSMSRIDTDNLEPTTHVLMKKNRTRQDESGKSELREKILDNAPGRDGRFITIPKVL